MAQRHKSAVKRHRQSLKRQERNRAIRTRLRHALIDVREAVESKSSEPAKERLHAAVKTLTKAVSKGVLHRNNAARRISRLSKQVASLTAR